MKKLLYILFVAAIAIGFSSCSSDSDDEDYYFRIKGAIDDGYRINLNNDELITTLNIETNINDWKLVKKDTREVYWSFDNDLTKPNNTLEVKGNGNKAVNVYLEKNPNKQDRAAHITLYYDGKSKDIIVISQKGTN